MEKMIDQWISFGLENGCRYMNEEMKNAFNGCEGEVSNYVETHYIDFQGLFVEMDYGGHCFTIPVLEIITSDDFVESVSKGIRNKYGLHYEKMEVGKEYKIGIYDIYEPKSQKEINRDFYFSLNFDKYIRNEQALHISRKSLDSFISSILNIK